MIKKQNKIVVICGGWLNEREVSLSSGMSVHKTLKDAGYNSALIEVKRDDIISKLTTIQIHQCLLRNHSYP